MLRGVVGEPLKRQVSIVPEKKYPFTILEAKAKQGANITCDLEALENSPNGGYRLTVENVRKDKGRYFDTVVLKTSSPIQPVINIRVYGNLFEPKPKPKAKEKTATP